MAGRKHVLSKLSKANMTKEELSIKEKAEEDIGKLDGIQKTPPNYLSSKAKGEWKRIYPLLEQLPIADIDRTLLEHYCQDYGIYRDLQKDINDRGLYVIDAKGNRVVNPSVAASNAIKREIRSAMSALCIPVNDRLRVSIEVSREESRREEDKSFSLSDL